ncbi:UNVERIFIED_CONTAM: hypothetical protein FKN15_073156 [Acipenser sinensis]
MANKATENTRGLVNRFTDSSTCRTLQWCQSGIKNGLPEHQAGVARRWRDEWRDGVTVLVYPGTRCWEEAVTGGRVYGVRLGPAEHRAGYPEQREASPDLHKRTLRCLVKQLEKGEVNVLDLKKNIEYAASVLEAVYIDETRQLLDTEDELCDIHSDAVPSEVRDWLASTFTKKMGVARRRPDEKPKFRSIVHAVQAGIFVDRYSLYRRRHSRSLLNVCFKDVDKWSFNVFALNEAGGEHALRFLVYELFTRYDLISRFRVPISALLNFVEALEVGYSKYKNPYHNLVHAADVTQTLHYFMVHTGLMDVDKWSFNVFALNEAGGEHALRFLVYELFTRYDLISRFRVPISALLNFVEALEVGYSKYKNPYHNLVHAADVTQTLHYFMVHTGLMHSLTELDIFAMVFAAAIHDFEHTGTTNNFHIQTRSDVAILYNDRSVLENHHISAAYRLMQEPEMNILANLSKDDWRELRTLVVDMVLYTDMSGHFQHIKNMKNALQQPEGLNSGGAGGVVESVQKHSKKVSTEDQGSSTDYSLSSIDLKGFRYNWVDIMHQNKERWKELAVQEQARKERESTNNNCKHSDKKSEVTEITEVKLTRTDSEKDSDSVSELKSPCELNKTSCNSSQNSNSTSAPQRTQQQADSSLSNSTVWEDISDRPSWNGNFFNNDQVLALPSHCLYSTIHNGSFTFRVTNFPKQKEVYDKDG